MNWDFRQHLQSDLKTVPEIVAEVTRVSAGERTPDTSEDALPALVWRCTRLTRGEGVAGDDSLREANVELVIWAKTLEDCLAIRDVLIDQYHPEEESTEPAGYAFGGRGDPGDENFVAPLQIDSSRVTNEYDGDRVADTYSLQGAVALTLEVNFMWHV